MTNREKLDKLSNYELVYFFYHKMIPIGKQYANSEKGIMNWLSAEADWDWWRSFHNEIYDYGDLVR